QLFFNQYLLEGLGIHEVIPHFIFIQILEFMTFYTNGVNSSSGREGMFQHTAGSKTAQPGSDKGISFPRFHMLEFNDLVEIIIKLNHKAIANIGRSCHVYLTFKELLAQML